MARKKEKITPQARKILDEYYSNGLSALQAYCKVRNIPIPKDMEKRRTHSSAVSQLKTRYPEYVAKIKAKNEKKYGKVKDQLIEQLQEVSANYQTLMNLAIKDELDEVELEKFRRLRSIMSAKDLIKANEIIGKMTGSFDQDKKQVTNVYTVSWGKEAPKELDNTINAEFEELEE